MARTAMTMSTGGQIAEHLSVGVLARTHPRERIRDILERMGLQSKRVRDLPAEALVYYVIALGLFMAVSTGEVLRCLVEGLQWLEGGLGKVKVAGKVAISQARSRLGAAPLKALWEESSTAMAVEGQQGSFYRGWRLVSRELRRLRVRGRGDHAARDDSWCTGRSAGSRLSPLRLS